MGAFDIYTRPDSAVVAREAATRLAAEREAARLAQLEPAELAEALRLAERGSIDGMRRVCESIERTHRITNETRLVMPEGAEAFSNGRQRRTVTPPVTSDETFAVRLHEAGHIIAGDCSDSGAHRRDVRETEWWHCLECERLAWAEALRLVPFNRAMFQRLQQGLRSYYRRTPAPDGVKRAAARLASDQEFAERVQARVDREARLEQYAEMQRMVEDARRQRPLSKLEQQIADVRRWGAEVGYGY